ncbi:hypothetical protein RCL1_005125 [Eukaryota sp. TZLM3-RCL]
MSTATLAAKIQRELSHLKSISTEVNNSSASLRVTNHQLCDSRRLLSRHKKFISRAQSTISDLLNDLNNPLVIESPPRPSTTSCTIKSAIPPHVPSLNLSKSLDSKSFTSRPSTCHTITRNLTSRLTSNPNPNPTPRSKSSRPSSSHWLSSAVTPRSKVGLPSPLTPLTPGNHGVLFKFPDSDPLPLYLTLLRAGTLRHLACIFSPQFSHSNHVELVKRSQPLFPLLPLDFESFESLGFPWWMAQSQTNINLIEQLQSSRYRSEVFSDQSIQAIISDFWTLFQRNSKLSKDDYYMLNLRICRALIPPINDFPQLINRLIENDWLLDSANDDDVSTSINSDRFYLSMIALAHQWSSSCAVSSIYNFLFSLLESISFEHKGSRKLNHLSEIVCVHYTEKNQSKSLGFDWKQEERVHQSSRDQPLFDWKTPIIKKPVEQTPRTELNSTLLQNTKKINQNPNQSTNQISNQSKSRKDFGRLSHEGLLRGQLMDKCLIISSKR